MRISDTHKKNKAEREVEFSCPHPFIKGIIKRNSFANIKHIFC
jgi:hypothetical protein